MDWTRVIRSMTLPVEVLAAVTLFCLPLQHRRSFPFWPVWFALCAALFQSGFSFAAPGLDSHLAISLVYSLCSYLCGLFYALICCRINVLEAMYATSSAYLTQHMAYCLYTLLNPGSMQRLNFRFGWSYFLIYGLIYLASYLLFARRLPTHGRYDLKVTHSVGMTAGALLVALVLSAFSQQLQPESGIFLPHLPALCHCVLYLCPVGPAVPAETADLAP